MVKAGESPMAQLHIRLPRDLAYRLRIMAIAEESEISQLCVAFIEICVEDWEMRRENQRTADQTADQR